MYIELYDRFLNHIGNIMNAKYEVTRRVFDADTSNFSGVCEKNVTEAFIFVLCDEFGNYEYSAFVKNLSQDNKLVKFKGEDFKSIFDTEIALNYTKEIFTSPRFLGEVFSSVVLELENQIGLMTEIIEVDFVVPSPSDSISWIGTYDYEYVIKNAKNFLKPYLAYYNYFIDSKFDRVNKKIVYEIKKTELEEDIKLEDFEFEHKLTDVKTNQTEAVLKWKTRNENELVWHLEEGPLYEDPTLVANWDYEKEVRYEENGDGVKPITSPTPDYFKFYNSIITKALLVEYHAYQSPIPIRYYVYTANFERIERPDFDRVIYYLGLDNKIYQDTIELENLRIPIKTKIFEEEIIANAQFKAINELVNSRYNENIILTNVNCPIDLSTLELNTMVNVYGENVLVENWETILENTVYNDYNDVIINIPKATTEFKVFFNDSGNNAEQTFVNTLQTLNSDEEGNYGGVIYTRISETELKISFNDYNSGGIWKPTIYKLEAYVDSYTPVKQLPVSEINNNNGLITVKLGFKKTLLTEVIKED